MKVYSKNITIARNVGTIYFWVTSYDYIHNENAQNAPRLDIATAVSVPSFNGDWVISSKGSLPSAYAQTDLDEFLRD